MKKKVLCFTILLVAIVFTTVRVNFRHDSKIDVFFNNVEALASDSEGGSEGRHCTGPKPNDHCLCDNHHTCFDEKGCR